MHINSSFVDNFYKLIIQCRKQQNILIMLFRGSSKARLPQQKLKDTPLKEAISRKILKNKNAIKVEHIQENKQTSASVSDQKELQELRLLQMVHAHELKDNPGYFGYQSWLSLNFQLWGQRVKAVSEQLWKILRLINQGQVNIPTGLVFQIANFLTKRERIEGLKAILQQFLQTNGIGGGICHFRQLKNYASLGEIVEGYWVQREQHYQLESFHRQQFNLGEFQTRVVRQQRLKDQELMKIRNHLLASQMKKCTFKPEISQYSSEMKSRSRKNCSQKYCSKRQPIHNANFEAAEINPKIYGERVLGIPGVFSHVHRQEYCCAERERVGRFKGERLFNLK